MDDRQLRSRLPPTGTNANANKAKTQSSDSEEENPWKHLESSDFEEENPWKYLETASVASAAEPSKACPRPNDSTSSRGLKPAIAEALPLAAASAAEPTDELLLRRAELTGLQQRTPNSSKLHQQARDFLNGKIQVFSQHQAGPVQSDPVDSYDWPTWREYVATLAAAEDIIGTKGIIAIRIEQIEGVQDPNRGGNRRVDIVLYNADGAFFRVHPGGRPASDAKVVQGSWTSIGATEPDAKSAAGAPEPGAIESASRQYHKPPEVLTREYAAQMPQNHCLGKMQMFSKVQALPKKYPLELTEATIEAFPWWLWIPNTGRVRNTVIGCGIKRIALVQTTTDNYTNAITSARFLIVHTDETALLLDALHDEGHRKPYCVEILVPDTSDYEWWVNWRSFSRAA